MAQTQGTIIILDIGRNVSTAEEKNQKSFFESAKECTARIIERKILSEGKNVIAIFLLGSKKTNNNMAVQCDGAFKYIDMLTEFQVPSWEMIRSLPEKPTEKRGDWFDALVVAADFYKNGVSGIKFSSKKIILMTNFKRASNFDPDSAQTAIKGFKEEGYEVDILGPDIYSDEHDKSIELARQFVEETLGATATFDHTMQYLLFHRKKAVKAMPWNVDLSIGPNIKIPVSAYIRIKDEPVVKKWEKAIKDPVTNTTSTSEALVKTKEFITPDNQKVEETDKISGYHYGQKIIPFSDCDKDLLYQSGEKCLSLYGFTNANNIQWQNLNGDGLLYIFGRKGDSKAQEAIRCLVECLHELNLAGIVRKVHNNNNAPKMFALLPVIDPNNCVCLSMIALNYKEDLKQMSFPSTNLKKYQCSDEQVNAFVDLIKAMDLTKAYDETYDDTEAFPIAECYSPSAQYVLDCIAFRAMNPDKPLPKPREEIMSLFEVPPMLVKNAKEPIDKIKKLFTLNKVESKPKKNKIIGMDIDSIQPLVDMNSANTGLDQTVKTDDPQVSDNTKIQMPAPPAPIAVKNIGTLDPVGDFKALTKQSKALGELGPEMMKVIEKLINYSIDSKHSKALDAIKQLRGEYLKNDPTDYNTWFQKFKTELIGSENKNALTLISENKLSFILKEENELSTYENEESHEESQLYENNTVPQSVELTISSDIADMFDD